jgi:hypothetical protein
MWLTTYNRDLPPHRQVGAPAYNNVAFEPIPVATEVWLAYARWLCGSLGGGLSALNCLMCKYLFDMFVSSITMVCPTSPFLQFCEPWVP